MRRYASNMGCCQSRRFPQSTRLCRTSNARRARHGEPSRPLWTDKKGGICAAQFVTLGRTLGSRAVWPPIAPRLRRLVGNAPVITAIRRPSVGLPTAEEEVRLTRVSDRPMALLVVELEERAALPDRDDV